MNFTKTILNGLKTWVENKFNIADQKITKIESNLEQKQPKGDYLTSTEAKNFATKKYVQDSIPTKVSDLQNDQDYVGEWYLQQVIDRLDYNDLNNIPIKREDLSYEITADETVTLSYNEEESCLMGVLEASSNYIDFELGDEIFIDYILYEYNVWPTISVTEQGKIEFIDSHYNRKIEVVCQPDTQSYLFKIEAFDYEEDIDFYLYYLRKKYSDYKQLDVGYLPSTVPNIPSAEKGQVVSVKKVNQDGVPTEWETVDMNINNNVSWNDLTDKPFGEEGEELVFFDGEVYQTDYDFGSDQSVTNFENNYPLYWEEGYVLTLSFINNYINTTEEIVLRGEDNERYYIDLDGTSVVMGMPKIGNSGGYLYSIGGNFPTCTVKATLSNKTIVPIDENFIPSTIPIIHSAEPDQAIAVKSVDENGTPTEWKTVAMSAGTGGDELEALSQLINYQSSLVVKDYSITENDEDFYKTYSIPDNKPVVIYVDMIAYADSECRIEVMTNTSTEKYVGYQAFTYNLPANEMISVAMPYSPLEDAQSIEMAFRNLSGTKIRVNKVIVSNITLNEDASDVISMIEEKAEYAANTALGTLGIDYIIPQMYGAYGDGLHDDTYAFQQCINNSQGKIIYIPSSWKHVSFFFS